MPLVKITNPPTEFLNSSEWGDFVARSDKNMVGLGLSIPIFSLTNWDSSTTKPEIAEGSIIEVGGSLYQADADTALTDEGGLIDGTVHIKLVPAGGGASVVPTLTNNVIPTWDAVKAGWYDGTDKFLPFEMDKASAVYTLKGEYTDKELHNKHLRQYYPSNKTLVWTGALKQVPLASWYVGPGFYTVAIIETSGNTLEFGSSTYFDSSVLAGVNMQSLFYSSPLTSGTTIYSVIVQNYNFPVGTLNLLSNGSLSTTLNIGRVYYEGDII